MRDYQEHNAKDIRDLTIYTKTIPAHPASFCRLPGGTSSGYPYISDIS